MLQNGRGSKQINKGGPKKKIYDMNNEENEVQTDRNEILKIRARFHIELHSSTFQGQHSSLKNTRPDSSEVSPIMTSEVKKTLKEMNNNKAPGMDNLTYDIMILGEKESVKQIKKKKKKILETKTIPVEWEEPR